MAAGTMIDSVEIPKTNTSFTTMTSSRKCFQMITTTTDYGTVFSYAFPVYNGNARKTTFCCCLSQQQMCRGTENV